MVKLSIVIPYFKTLELTEQLLMELIIQDEKEIEVIVVDDGCNEKKLDEFTGFNHIKIIHQDNTGVAGARNKGIEEAQGKYIAFIDSDDMVMPNYVKTLLELIDTKDEDIICFNWLDINTNEVVIHPNNPSVWKAIYKRDILPRFEECYKTREDYFFNCELDRLGCTKYYYDKVLYIYNSGREDGLTCRSQKGEI